MVRVVWRPFYIEEMQHTTEVHREKEWTYSESFAFSTYEKEYVVSQQ